jgi:hypothetical protein
MTTKNNSLEKTKLKNYINEIIKKDLEDMDYSFDDLVNELKIMNLLNNKEIIPTIENAEIYKGQIARGKNNINYRSVPHLTTNKYIWSKVGSLPETRYLLTKEKELTENLSKLLICN